VRSKNGLKISKWSFSDIEKISYNLRKKNLDKTIETELICRTPLAPSRKLKQKGKPTCKVCLLWGKVTCPSQSREWKTNLAFFWTFGFRIPVSDPPPSDRAATIRDTRLQPGAWRSELVLVRLRPVSRTALQKRGLARGCPPRLRRRHLPAASKFGEGRQS